MKKIQLSLFVFALIALSTKIKAQILLSQDFNASTVGSTYIGTEQNQFDYIGVSAPAGNTSVYFSSNKLTMQRYGGNAAIVKSTNLSPTPPSFLKIRFKMSVPFNSTPTSIPSTQAFFYVGSGLVASATTTGELANNGSRHSTVFIGFGTSGKFYLRSPSFTNSDSLTGENVVTWFINNSGASADYADPNGGVSTVADDQSDLWVGNVRIFAGMAAQTPSVDLNNFKLLFSGANGGGGAISLDDIEISTGVTALPVNLLSFTGKVVNNNAVQLDWSTVNETNNKYFQILKSTNGVNYSPIATVNGNNNTQTSTYSYTDNKPSTGTNYYQLKQVDNDGKSTTFNTVAVQIKNTGNAKLRILSNAATEIKVSVNLPKATYGSIRLTDIDGRMLYQTNGNYKEGENVLTIHVANLQTKICVLQFTNAEESISLKILK
ncbi:MAG: hypothetical protein ACOVNY_06035 [Chitinophagaceae bacterium]